MFIPKRLYRTKSPTNVIPIVKPPPLLYAAPGYRQLLDGSRFYRLTEYKRPSMDPRDLPPAIRVREGRLMSETDLAAMHRLHTENPQHWSIGRLIKRFNAPYTFVHDHVLSEDERRAIEHKEEQLLINLSVHRLKGLMLRQRVRMLRMSSK
jgi:hypothetical protein